jgi:NAD(P)-dependent dehydrogenase (short-subunit alcohol dehydrogenase family)
MTTRSLTRRQLMTTVVYAPMKRIGTPAEISQAILYLPSFEVRFVTGAALPIDGGATAGR